MEYAIKQKTHVYDLLYPFAAKQIGMKSLSVRDNKSFAVKYHSNKYCSATDNADNAAGRMTVECDMGNSMKVLFIPCKYEDLDCIEYNVYVNDDYITKLTSMEWEVIRPKIYANFTEYFNEFGNAIEVFQQLSLQGTVHPFILSHYKVFFESFRDMLYSQTKNFTSDGLPNAVDFIFKSKDIYGQPVCEHAIITKTFDNRLMLHVYSLN